MTNNNINNASDSKGTKRSPFELFIFFSSFSHQHIYLLSLESIGKSAPSLRGRLSLLYFTAQQRQQRAGRRGQALPSLPETTAAALRSIPPADQAKPSPPTRGADLYPAIKSLDISLPSPPMIGVAAEGRWWSLRLSRCRLYLVGCRGRWLDPGGFLGAGWVRLFPLCFNYLFWLTLSWATRLKIL